MHLDDIIKGKPRTEGWWGVARTCRWSGECDLLQTDSVSWLFLIGKMSLKSLKSREHSAVGVFRCLMANCSDCPSCLEETRCLPCPHLSLSGSLTHSRCHAAEHQGIMGVLQGLPIFYPSVWLVKVSSVRPFLLVMLFTRPGAHPGWSGCFSSAAV